MRHLTRNHGVSQTDERAAGPGGWVALVVYGVAASGLSLGAGLLVGESAERLAGGRGTVTAALQVGAILAVLVGAGFTADPLLMRLRRDLAALLTQRR